MDAISTAPAAHAAPDVLHAPDERALRALAFADADARLRAAEDRRAAALSTALAAHLATLRAADAPCPVCGVVCPRDADAHAALVLTERSLDDARRAWREARKALDDACRELPDALKMQENDDVPARLHS